MSVCWNCGEGMAVDISVVGDVTWTTRLCPVCGTMSTVADKGELDLGLIREHAQQYEELNGVAPDTLIIHGEEFSYVADDEPHPHRPDIVDRWVERSTDE